MSIIRCQECEKMIDSDVEETTTAFDREYCQECYFTKLELCKTAIEKAIKGFLDIVNTGASKNGLLKQQKKRKPNKKSKIPVLSYNERV